MGWAGAIGSALAAGTLAYRLATDAPGILAVLGAVMLIAVVGRPLLLGRRR
jgi:hypothetical protein